MDILTDLNDGDSYGASVVFYSWRNLIAGSDSNVYFGQDWRAHVRVAPTVELTTEQEIELTKLARSKRRSVRLAQRAQIVLLAAKGRRNTDIADQLGIG